MGGIEENINKAISEAEKIRDELSLKSSLGAAVTKEKFAKLNDKYEIFKEKSQKILDTADESVDELKIAAELGIQAKNREEVITALELAAEEIKYSYQKIQNLIY
ncbi:hypothetical protein [Sulfurovum riftiae]|uniref:Uncharacterized protein n=1 Tax=Sulfurovum riftiae TaxID=1630136 RepID=A0A151CGD4_9BACT|nr:hypothetical protein [Sulfurovum riftiae]KYJ86561.1 hypothetical protein AS592_07095 [Sulfurovum riftiae]